MSKFKHELKAKVIILASATIGTVSARIESVNTANQYQVHYPTTTGAVCDDWLFENQIKAAPVAAKPKRAAAPAKKKPAAARKRKPAAARKRKPAAVAAPTVPTVA